MLIAIDNENIEMMELLIGARVELGDALLHAINEENVDAVELLLKAHQQQAGKKNLEVSTTARVLASQAEAIVRTGKTWPQATKRRN